MHVAVIASWHSAPYMEADNAVLATHALRYTVRYGELVSQLSGNVLHVDGCWPTPP